MNEEARQETRQEMGERADGETNGSGRWALVLVALVIGVAVAIEMRTVAGALGVDVVVAVLSLAALAALIYLAYRRYET